MIGILNNLNVKLGSALLAVFVSISTLSSCSSPADEQRNRESAMKKFVTQAVEHYLDRNPETIQTSMLLLTRDEMTKELVDKLQAEKLLPESDLYVLKWKTDFEATKSSNQVAVDSVTPLAPVTGNEVPFRVAGKDVKQVAGKPVSAKPFDFKVICMLTSKMDGMPRITELTSDAATKAAAKPAEAATKEPASKTERRRSRRHR